MSKILNELFLFRGVGISEREINSLFTRRFFGNGKTICDKNTSELFVGVVLSGRAAAFSQSGTILNTFMPGDVFGAASVLSNGFVSATVALADCKIAVLSAETLKKLFSDYPVTAVNFIAFLSERIEFLNRKIDIFTSPDCESRVYSAMISSADTDGEIALGKQKLAETLDIGRTSVYRAIWSLEEKKLITSVGKGKYIIGG